MSQKDYSVEHNDFVSSSDNISKHVGYTGILLLAQLTFLNRSGYFHLCHAANQKNV